MHNNYYFLQQLTPALDQQLSGSTVTSCFTQQKGELIIGFTNDQQPFFIKAHLTTRFCCLSFPADFKRARKNSVDLLQAMVGCRVRRVRQFINERSFALELTDKRLLLFKMHGNRSNVILFIGNEVQEVFNNDLKNDFELHPDTLDKPLEQTYEAFINAQGDLKVIFPTFGRPIKQYLDQQGYQNAALDERWTIIGNLLTELNKKQYYITSGQFSLLPIEDASTCTDPIKAITEFFIKYMSSFSLEEERRRIIGQLQKEITKAESYINQAKKKIIDLKLANNYQQHADLLMANLHQIPAHAKQVTVANFYTDNEPLTLKLNPKISAQKQAEQLYRKAKNQHIELERLSDNIQEKEHLLNEKLSLLEEAAHTTNLKALRALLPSKESQQQTVTLPFHRYAAHGFNIWVGRNARANDRMLQRHAYKEDLWLHAKDVSGSHVLIKHQAGKSFPASVKERAAELAAWYSKRKTDSLCPVIATPRKYVRKRKGDPPGAVVVDKEIEVLLVKPQNHLS